MLVPNVTRIRAKVGSRPLITGLYKNRRKYFLVEEHDLGKKANS